MMAILKSLLDNSNISVTLVLHLLSFLIQFEIFLVLGMGSDFLKFKFGHLSTMSLESESYLNTCSSWLPLKLPPCYCQMWVEVQVFYLASITT